MLGYIISDKDEINVKEHEIFSFDILHKTNLNIFVIKNNKVLNKNNIINYASFNGHVQVLEWFKNSGYKFKYDYYTPIYYACKSGHIQVLEWFKNSGYEFKYDYHAINDASYYGRIQVLEWFNNSGYEFKYSKYAINRAYINEHIQIVEFFKKRNVKKVIKWSKPLKFLKTIKFKTHDKYLKGYQKN